MNPCRRILAFASRFTLAAPLALVAVFPATAHAADKQIRPYIGSTFGGSTTFVDPDQAVGKPSLVLGISFVTLGNILGVEADLADSPGFFQGDTRLVLTSRVTTLTGNVIVAAPRRLTEYTFRPYVVGGAGLMRVHEEDYFGAFKVDRFLPAIDVGAGVLAFLTGTVGVTWEVRRFQNIGGQTSDTGVTFGPEHLSFWRATMAVAIRY